MADDLAPDEAPALELDLRSCAAHGFVSEFGEKAIDGLSETQNLQETAEDHGEELKKSTPMGKNTNSIMEGIKGRDGERRRYSRAEMEKLRLVDPGEQRRMWKEVYQGLESVIAQEYDELEATQHQKPKPKPKRKKKEPPAITGDMPNKSNPTRLGAQICGHNNAGALVGLDIGEVTEEFFSGSNIIDGDDSSDDEHVSIQRPAFWVEGEPDFESGPPLDGLEYLRRVRWEAAQIPKVKVAKLNSSKLCSEQTPYMPNIPEITKCPPNLSPSRSWEAAFLADFSEIRQAFSRLESSSDEKSSKQSDGTWQARGDPTVTVMLGMDAVSRAAMLREHVRAVEQMSVVRRADCVWLFALCAAVDAPLDGETCAALRGLLRKCSSLLGEKLELDDEVAMLVVLITIAGKYFGQSER